jgi:peptidoglycan biosynthesis protein MviN/MurJ (putative lipid II flippase)
MKIVKASIKKESLSFKTAVMIVSVALSKMTGFIRSAALAAIFGLSAQTDAFYLSTKV